MRTEAEHEVLKLFGARVVELRKRLNLSQEQLALQSGIARSYIGEVERGSRNPAVIIICRLAETLGVAPRAMLDFEADLPTLASSRR